MHSVAGKSEVLAGPDLSEVVRQTLREYLSLLSVECATNETADGQRNQNSTARLHAKWYNFRVAKFEMQQARERGIEHG